MKTIIAITLALVLSACRNEPTSVKELLATAKPIELTQAERDFVATREIVMAYPKNIAPTVYDKNGKPAGHSAAVTELVAKRTGLRIRYVMFETNADIIPSFMNNSVDAVMAATDIVERRALITISSPYGVANGVMLVGEPPVAVPMKVAIGSKYAVQESISKLAKLVQFVPFPDDESGFKALMNREVGAAIMAQPIADHLEAKNDIAFRRSPMNFVYVVGYGCQVSEVTMCRILSKGVESITPHEKKLLERTFYVKPIEPIVDPIKYEPS